MTTPRKLFYNKVVLVTGGTGSVGSEIVRQLLTFGLKEIRIFSRDETKQYLLQNELENTSKLRNVKYIIGDIRDKERLNWAMEGVNIVFHAAALKHVPSCENNPFEAVKTNVLGTQNLIDAAIKYRVEKVIAISTDKAVYPNNVMGVTKLLMEGLITSASNYSPDTKTKFAVVRFGNVLNSRGSVIPIWMEQIKIGKPITVTDKRMKRFFMSIPEAVNLVFSAVTLMVGKEIFVLKMPEIEILDLAKKIIRENANGKEVPIKFIGIRSKEKIVEKLYTDQEKETMMDIGPFFIILPNDKELSGRLKKYKSTKISKF